MSHLTSKPASNLNSKPASEKDVRPSFKNNTSKLDSSGENDLKRVEEIEGGSHSTPSVRADVFEPTLSASNRQTKRKQI